MTDKWTGKQKGDAEFKPPAPPTPSPPPPPGTITKEVIDGWTHDYRRLLDGPGRPYDPRRDLDYRPKYKPRFETATEVREKQRDWERSKGRAMQDIEYAVEQTRLRSLEMMAIYSKPMFSARVIAQRMIVFNGEREVWRLDVPTEKQSKLAELFDKAAQVPGYMHWWAENDPERMKQTREAAAEIAGALRYDADYWRRAYPDLYDLAAWIARGIVEAEATRIKVETVRDHNDGYGLLSSGIVS